MFLFHVIRLHIAFLRLSLYFSCVCFLVFKFFQNRKECLTRPKGGGGLWRITTFESHRRYDIHYTGASSHSTTKTPESVTL